MYCEICGFDNVKIIDSRMSGEYRRRRYKCLNCEYRFTTYEVMEEEFKFLKTVERIGHNHDVEQQKKRYSVRTQSV